MALACRRLDYTACMMEQSSLSVAVTGATGFVGRHVVRALVSRGHTVRALVRDRAKARETLPTQGVEWVLGDMDDAGALARLCNGAEAAVHCIGIRREFAPEVTFEKAHVQATRTLLDASKGAGVRRLIHVSALGTRPGAATKYHRTKYEAETLVRRSDLDWTIVRPSLIHGEDGEFMRMVKDWVLGRSAPYFVLPYFVRVEPPKGFPPVPGLVSAKVQPVHVDDVAGAIAAALESREAVGEVYPLAGSEILDWPTLLTTIRDALPLSDKSKKPAPLPGILGAAMAWKAELVGLGAALPFGPSEPIMATEESTASLDKVRQHLHLRPRAFSSSLREYAGRV